MSAANFRRAAMTLYLRQLLAAVLLGGLAWGLFGVGHAYVFLFGLLWALADTGIIFFCTRQGLGKTGTLTKLLLKFMFLIRLALAIIIVFIILRMKLGLLEVFFGFILMNVCFIFNLLIFTRRNKDKSTAVKKGGKEDGSC